MQGQGEGGWGWNFKESQNQGKRKSKYPITTTKNRLISSKKKLLYFEHQEHIQEPYNFFSL